MKKITVSLLKIYCLVLVTALIVVGLKKVSRPSEVIMPLLFLPVFGYITTSFRKIKKIISVPMLAYGLVFSTVLLVAEIINVRRINDVLMLLVVAPLPVFFLLESRNKLIKSFELIKNYFRKNPPAPEATARQAEPVDETRRKFLKIAAGTSLATAVMFFLKRQSAGAAFFGSGGGPSTISIKDTNGNKVNPSIQQPLDGYSISDMDTSNADQYFGFLNKDNAWYILKVGSDNSIRYAKGSSNYSTAITGAWATRSGQSYGLFNDVF